MQGTLGVHSAIQRPGAKDRTIPTRLGQCRNGHGAIGQVWIEGAQQWAGDCPDCGDCPQ
jgi:hypothetical protein